jgi:hypothetical protein
MKSLTWVRGSFRASNLLAAGVLLVVPLLVGCSQESTGHLSAVKAVAGRIMSAELPEGVRSLADTYADVSEGQEVVVAGRIFASIASPFAPDTASFSLIELPKPGHDHENPGDCPFCKREMENAATAIVEVVGEDDSVFSVPADKLLGLQKNQDVVVVGTTSMVGEILVIRARAIHVLASDKAKELAKRFAS